jgi:hypothetical protein
MIFVKDESNKALLSEKKFSKECMKTCVAETRYLIIKTFLYFA